MKKLLVLLGALLLGCSTQKAEPKFSAPIVQEQPLQLMDSAPPPQERIVIEWRASNDEDMPKAIRASMAHDKMLFLYLNEDFCIECIKMEQETFKDKELSNILNKNYIPAKLNMSRNQEITKAVGQLPSFLIFNPSGDLILRVSGYINASDLKIILQSTYILWTKANEPVKETQSASNVLHSQNNQ